MTDRFRALVISGDKQNQKVDVTEWSPDQLMDGDVTVRVEYSTLNYKDGLALTGTAPIIRSYPLIPGIDFAGTVEASEHGEFKPGDRVVLNGWGVGEKHHGGYAQLARVPGDWLVPLPRSLDTRRAMAIGTAGYTAMLCVLRLEGAGLDPDAGEVLVTGACGGVGSVAVSLLAKAGYTVVASTGRTSEVKYLESLGASRVIDRGELSGEGRPLGKTRWAGAVDTLGSRTLANVLSELNYGAAAAACGLAQGMDLPANMAPFILRNVSLLGVDSVMAPKAQRLQAWERLARDLDHEKLDAMTAEIPLADLPSAAGEILAGRIRGRTVVNVNA